MLRAWAATAEVAGAGDLVLERLSSLRVELAEPAPELVAPARRREAADVADTCARLLASAGRTQEAVQQAETAAEEFEELGAPVDAGQASWLAGRLLRDLGRTTEAVARLQRAGGQLVGAGPARAGAVDDLVAVLRAAGREDEAQQAARTLLR